MKKLNGRKQMSTYRRNSSMNGSLIVFVAVIVLVAGSGLYAQSANVSHDPVMALEAAGDAGGGVLTPGTFYPPTQQGQSTFVRTTDSVFHLP